MDINPLLNPLLMDKCYKTFWNYIAVVVAQLCECTKTTEGHTLKG